MYREIEKCRICGNTDLITILNLGNQFLTGIFPKAKSQVITAGPLELVKCQEDKDTNFCGLVQLRHSYNLNELYGDNYGYRSGLNKSMVQHLHNIVKKMMEITSLSKGDMVIDIGGNDGTLLRGYPINKFVLVGIDPTANKFKEYYPKYIELIPDFFSAESIKRCFGNRKAKVVTSIAMFYDLESPIDFMRQVYEILDDEGIWAFEQSYLPAMLEMNAYDTICHEHLEYYRLKQIKWVTDKVGFKIINIELNSINGGSFAVTVAKSRSSYTQDTKVDKILQEEKRKGLSNLKAYVEFSKRIFKHRDELVRFIHQIKSKNKTLLGYGASTKGNVILQFCKLSEKNIPFIAEVNKDKFGCYTPGTLIPIISEEEARKMKPDYFMVLPWHFKENIINREKGFLKSGGKLFFPLPSLEVV